MKHFYERAQELQPELERARRQIHRFGGVGFDVRESAELIKAELRAMGLEPREICECGIVAKIGAGAPVFLLRADFDALPMEEQTGLPYAAQNGTCHACGHDFHAAMLLGAARLLKERESELGGTVKLMFQPAEETTVGAATMVDAGVLENPHVDAAFAIHIAAGLEHTRSGQVRYSRGAMYSAAEGFAVTVHGRGSHGALPHEAVDPISILARIVLNTQHILAYERPADEMLVISFGTLSAGTVGNVVPDSATARGSIRVFSPQVRELALRRFREIAEKTAETFDARAEVRYTPRKYPIDPVINNAALAEELLPYIADAAGAENVLLSDRPEAFGSEDFCCLSTRVPSVIVMLDAGSVSEGYTYPQHNPRVTFDERALPLGAAVHACAAFGWLERRKKQITNA